MAGKRCAGGTTRRIARYTSPTFNRFHANSAPAYGQVARGEDSPSAFERRASGAITAWVMQPTGELRQNIGAGIGFGGAGLFRLDHAGALALRVDLGIGGYGSESKRVPLSPT